LANICESYEENKTVSFFRSQCIFQTAFLYDVITYPHQHACLFNTSPCLVRFLSRPDGVL